MPLGWRAGLARVPARTWKAGFWLVTALVLFLALRPVPMQPQIFQYMDKLQHAAAFAVLAALGLQAGWRSRWKLGLALVGLGVAIELLQMLTATRQPEVADAVADALGVLLVLAFWRSGQPQEDGR